ncbi:hypothetical protein M758_8G055500 [Ceratodon purpureus]|uniref:Protein kinase domain-containing protein n=1 Tax=Ceratodon purpureus TaxID=3225 RepID=A0A8T0H043_CERPU|nr:hypothetical protein KC19_8G058300 [Ceratodon purpureus]KAG0607796.1 hypothetical protein M758_8G055500 [Ceratodon purpureus]
MTKRRHGSESTMVTKMATALMVVFGVVSVAGQDLASDTRGLVTFGNYHDPKGVKLNWTNTTSTCSWVGITCTNNRVTEVRLPGKGFRGIIPPGSLGTLSELQVVSLRGNKLREQFPGELGNLKKLQQLYLAGNEYYGSLPDISALWPGLTSLGLEYNSLNGTIPESLGLLTQLYLLILRNNSFSGRIPPLNLANLTLFDVANNNLSGLVPTTLSRFPAESFAGNAGLCGPPLGAVCSGPTASSDTSSSSSKHKKLSGGAIAGIVVGGVVFLVLVILGLLFCLCRGQIEREDSISPTVREITHERPGDIATREKTRERNVGEAYGEEYAIAMAGENTTGKLVSFSLVSFDLEDLLRASAEVLGKGSVGTAYKAILEDGTIMAVKRLKDVTTNRKEFESLIQGVGKLQHRNVVPLRAYYFSKDEKLLVSDFMPMGSLAAILHSNRGSNRMPVDWLTRVRIAIGAAKGLAYLHAQGGPNFVHGNIKSSNVLLNRDREACISDFGLTQLLTGSPSSSKSVGYRAPEVKGSGVSTQKSDVYSFGVLLLELLTGKAPSQPGANGDALDLPKWVQSIVREEWTAEVFDLELMRYQNIEGEMVSMLQIAMKCVDPVPERRPKMSHVLSMLEDVHPFFIENGAEPSRQSESPSEEMVREITKGSQRNSPSDSHTP